MSCVFAQLFYLFVVVVLLFPVVFVVALLRLLLCARVFSPCALIVYVCCRASIRQLVAFCGT